LEDDCRRRLQDLICLLFQNSVGFSGALSNFNLDSNVLDVFTATLLLHYLDMKETYGSSLYLQKLHWCAQDAGFTTTELGAISIALWASFFSKQSSTGSIREVSKEAIEVLTSQMLRQAKLIEEQAELLQQSNEQLVTLNKRLERIEGAFGILQNNNDKPTDALPVRNESVGIRQTQHKKRKEAPKSLAHIWFHWYVQLERKQTTAISRQRFNDYKQIVQFMKMFLLNGFEISSPLNKSQVALLGREAEKNLLLFVRQHNISSTTGGSVLKSLKQLENRGLLVEFKTQYARLLESGKIKE